MKSLQNLLSLTLIGVGAVGFAVASKPLVNDPEARVPLNVLGINRSPYGEVIAMSMQGSIDTYFHAVESSGHVCEDPELCGHHPRKPSGDVAGSGDPTLTRGLRDFLDGMGSGLAQRTNPRAATQAHKFFLRRGIEDKLKFAYDLDPSHYGNYNAYHLFLTEPELGTRPELTPTAAKLAQETITYCFSLRNDPRQALTAAAAAGNVVQLMFTDRVLHPESPRFSTAQMRECLAITDQAIGLFSQLSNDWVESDQWSNLSNLRVEEIKDRFSFIVKLRDTHEQGIRRLEGLPDQGSASVQSN